jgi:hypothetical protein
MLPHSYTLGYSIIRQGSSLPAHRAMVVNQRMHTGIISPQTFRAPKLIGHLPAFLRQAGQLSIHGREVQFTS